MGQANKKLSFLLAIFFVVFSITGNTLIANIDSNIVKKSINFKVDKQLTPIVNLLSKIPSCPKYISFHLFLPFYKSSPLKTIKHKNDVFAALDLIKQGIYEYLFINAP